MVKFRRGCGCVTAHSVARPVPGPSSPAQRLSKKSQRRREQPKSASAPRESSIMARTPWKTKSGNVLRFTTAGNVDDGKSTLIGRLLVETQGAFEDHIEGAKRENERRGGKGIDFSLLTDGLKAEREQGITIDVAYRYFATPKRKFIIADAPGHEQYTRNMVTAASTADLAVLLVDARHGVVTQTRRHAMIAHLLGISHLIVAVNKMD